MWCFHRKGLEFAIASIFIKQMTKFSNQIITSATNGMMPIAQWCQPTLHSQSPHIKQKNLLLKNYMFSIYLNDYIRRHLRCRRFCGSGLRTARTASSKTCLRPLWVRAEHSIYFTALILFANFWPCSRFIGKRPWSERILRVSLSSRRSILVPKIKF